MRAFGCARPGAWLTSAAPYSEDNRSEDNRSDEDQSEQDQGRQGRDHDENRRLSLLVADRGAGAARAGRSGAPDPERRQPDTGGHPRDPQTIVDDLNRYQNVRSA